MQKIKEIISRFCWAVFPSLMANRTFKRMKNGENIIVHGNNDLYENLTENFSYFLTEEQRKDKNFIKKLSLDIIECYHRYGTEVNEYFSYKFMGKKHKVRKQYLSRRQKDVYLSNYYGNECEEKISVLKDKYRFYTIAKNYFKRDAILISSMSDLQVFDDFIHNHRRAFAKLISGRGGKGAHLIKLEDVERDGLSCYLNGLLLGGNQWIIEELVEQDERMAYWNRSSINTVRISSIMTSNGPESFYPFMRFGKAGSIVDNASSGGYFVALDKDSGFVITDAFDKRGQHHTFHPEHGDIVKGHPIPDWSELNRISKELHESLFSDHKYIGFDFALTPKGWVVIEANWGHFAPLQVAIERGVRKEFLEIMKL